jgi:hypothetical protein
MLNWFKRILGVAPVEPTPVVETPVVAKPKAKTKAAPKKKTTKKSAKVVDLSAMKKDELLAHGKKAGAKVNAGMKKADIIEAIKAA